MGWGVTSAGCEKSVLTLNRVVRGFIIATGASRDQLTYLTLQDDDEVLVRLKFLKKQFKFTNCLTK
jgi:hypothetical protein